MNSVMMSIKPKWCELIASGKKTIEVRKTKPKLDTPFKCYIYCTKDSDIICRDAKLFLKTCEFSDDYICNGKVIGEFVCDRIDEAHWVQDFGYAGVYKSWKDEEDCIPEEELLDYMGDKEILYGWHISNLVIYDKPKELRRFNKPCHKYCDGCKYEKHETMNGVYYVFCDSIVKRPPQSWCYVEELEIDS